MTQRERFFAFVHHERVDRIPRYARFSNDLKKQIQKAVGAENLEAYFDMDRYTRFWPDKPKHYKPYDFSHYFPGRQHGEKGFTINADGIGSEAGGFYHFAHIVSPLAHAEKFEEIENYPCDDWSTWDWSKYPQQFAEAKEQGFVTAVTPNGMFEWAWGIRGIERFMEDMLLRPEWAEVLLDKIRGRLKRVIMEGAKAGADMIIAGEDIGTQNGMMISPETWRALLKPRWIDLFSAARAIKPDIVIWYHSDGNVWDVLDDLVEIGMNILNPVQPECMDPVAIRRRFGKRLALDGTLGTQTTFPFDSPEGVRRVVRERINTLSPGLMLAPTHILEPDVLVDNVLAFFDEVDKSSSATSIGACSSL